MKPFKRQQTPDAPYYVRFMVKGQRILWCTKTNDKRTAIARGRQHRDLIIEGRFDLVAKQKSRDVRRAPLAKLKLAYEQAARMLTRSTRQKNWLALKKLTGLTEESHLGEMTEIRHLPDPNWTQSQLRSWNSYLRQARSIFSEQYMDAYKQLHLPDLMWLRKARFCKVKSQKWRAPTSETIDAVLAKVAELEAARDPLGLVLILGIYAGMRSDEVVHARWDWITDHGIRVEPDREWLPKGDSRIVPISQPVRERLLALRQTVDYVVPGETKTDREDLVRRDAPKLLRALGITDRKPFHALRKLAGSLIADGQGLYAAQRFLGHSSVKTTEMHYVDQTRAVSPVVV
jgi:integrase